MPSSEALRRNALASSVRTVALREFAERHYDEFVVILNERRAAVGLPPVVPRPKRSTFDNIRNQPRKQRTP